jgi:hypothetical protein
LAFLSGDALPGDRYSVGLMAVWRPHTWRWNEPNSAYTNQFLRASGDGRRLFAHMTVCLMGGWISSPRGRRAVFSRGSRHSMIPLPLWCECCDCSWRCEWIHRRLCHATNAFDHRCKRLTSRHQLPAACCSTVLPGCRCCRYRNPNGRLVAHALSRATQFNIAAADCGYPPQHRPIH